MQLLVLFLSLLISFSSFAQKKDAETTEFIKWWRSNERDVCLTAEKLRELKTANMELPDSKLKLKAYKMFELDWGNAVLVTEVPVVKNKKAPGPAAKAWIGMDSRNNWTAIAEDPLGGWGSDTIRVCLYKRGPKIFVDILDNGPACEGKTLYEYRDPKFVKIDQLCGG